MSPIRRHGWVARLWATTMILALTLPFPAQAFAQALADQRTGGAHASRYVAGFADPSSDSGHQPSHSGGYAQARPVHSPLMAASPAEVLPVLLLPKRVEWLSNRGANIDPWQLFDGKSTALAPVSSESVTFAVDLQEPRAVAAITILGPTEGTLSVFAQDGSSLRQLPALEAVRIHARANEWRRVSVDDPTKVSRLVLKWTPLSLTGPAEIGLWGRWLPPRDATDPVLADRVLTNAAPGALVATATPDRVTAARVSLDAAAPRDGVVHVELSADPRSWAHAFLVYELTGLGHFTQAVRQINGMMPRGGVPPAHGATGTIEGGLQVEEISPEWLKLGDNEIRFLSLPQAGAPDYSVQRVRIVGTGHSSLFEARMVDAKASASGAIQHFAFDGASQAHDLVFELLEPSKGRLSVRAAGAGVPALQQIELKGRAPGWHHVSLDALPANTTAIDVSVDKAAGAGLGLSEGRSSPVSEVVLTASPIANEADARAIAISYPLHGECRSQEAWITGFVAVPSGDQLLELRVNRQDVTSLLGTDHSFALRLHEPAMKQKKAWEAVIVARLASGRLVRRTVRLGSCVDDATVAMPATVVDEGAPYSQLVRAGEKKTIAFAGAKLEIPAGALDRDVRITIRPLVAEQVPDTSPRVNNASPGRRAYRLGPHGLKFKKPVKITLPYDASTLKQGESERDLFAFYYDEPLASWQRIGRYDVARAGSLTSLTEHFTNFIAGTLSMPDEPGVKSFDANEMKGIKVGDPGAGVDFIAPPSANSNGSVNLQYPIELPPGRNGVEPSLAFSYSNEKANGWLGLGWDLRLSSVEVDTRFGVPRYNENTYGRDRYLVDGEQIVPKTPGGNTYVRRVESTFDTIVRNVDANNCVTSWSITDKHGKVFTYGGTGAMLAQPGAACNVFRWGLSSVQDTFGSRMVVSYVADGAPSGSADPFVALYPAQIDYTAHVTGASTDLAAAYRVLFIRDAGNVRQDVIVSGRPGFQERTRYRLDHVDVQLLNGSLPPTLIRRYQLAYEAPSLSHFYKSLLTSIGQQGLGAAVQLDQHTFQYGGAQVGTDGNKTTVGAYGAPEKWGFGQNNSALSQTDDKMGGGSGTLGIGLPIVSFTVTAGGNGGDETTQRSTLDLNGDGLPDLSASGSGYMNFLHPELSVSSPVNLHLQQQGISGLGSLGHTNKSGWNISGGVSFVGVGATAAYSSTSSDDDVVMTDIDGDGWVDRASVSNNTLQWQKNDGSNHFAPQSSSNSSLSLNTKDPNAAFVGSASQGGGLVRINPLVRWRPSFAGPVTISGAVSKLNPGGNGVDVAIYKNGSLLWGHAIAASDLTVCDPAGVNGCSGGGLTTTVAVTDALYFMASPHHDPNGPANQVGLESTANQLSWDPIVTYDNKPTAVLEPYGLPVYQFKQSVDHRLLRPEVQWVASADGVVHVQNPSPYAPVQSKQATSDDVKIRVLKHPRDNPSSSQDIALPNGGNIPASSTSPIALDSTISVKKGDSITVEVLSDTPVEFRRLGLTPSITYSNYCRNVSGGDVPFCGDVTCTAGSPLQCVMSGDPEPDSPVTADLISQGVHVSYPFPQFFGGPTAPLVSPSAQTLNVTGALSFSSLTAPAFVLVQGVNQLYSKTTVTPDFNGDAFASVNTSAAVQAGGELMVTVYSSSTPYFVGGSLSAGGSNAPVNVMYGDPRLLNPDGTPMDPMSGGFHRWSAGFYNGDLPGSFSPSNIVFPLNAAGAPVNNPTKFFFGVPQHDSNLLESWSGPGGAYIAAGQVNASRGSARLGSGGGGGLNALRHASTWNFELSGHVPFVSLGVNQGQTSNDHDFFDINGDRYPDAVSADGTVQYGDGLGGFKWTETVNGISSLDALRRVDHGSFRGTLSIGDVQLITDTATDGSVRKSLTTGFSVGTDYGLSSTSIDWVDVNGDGLPDAVTRSASDGSPNASHAFGVRLNYGYRLGPQVSWPANAWGTTSANSATGVAGKTVISAQMVTDLVNFFGGSIGVNGVRLQDTGSNNVNVGGGVDTGGISFGGGGGFSFGVTRTLVDMVDVNGDGLPDQVMRVAGDQTSNGLVQYIRVRLNLGDHFDTNDTYWSMPNWDPSIDPGVDFAFSGNINDSLGFRRSKSSTASFEFKVCFILCVGASGFHETGTGWSHSNFEDLDGDGRPDMVFKSTKDTAVWAKLNQLPQTLNLLTRVNRPLGGSFEIQYERKGNLVRRDLPLKQDSPSSKQVMSRVDVADGRGNHYVRAFTYDQAGYHDRIEREDYGFAKVTTARLHQDSSVYSTRETVYHNQDFYRKGLTSQAIVRGASSTPNVYNVFSVESHTYAASGNGGTCSTPLPPGSVFPAELGRTTGYFEGTSSSATTTPPVSTSETRKWDCFGNLTDMVDLGDTGANNDVSYHVDYNDPALLAANIHKPSRAIAKDHFGKVMRDRKATYDGRGALLTMNEVVIGGVDPLTGLPNNGDPAINPTWTYGYDAFGNVSRVLDPRGYTLDYVYDPKTKTHRTQVVDSFGYGSTSVPDLRFGVLASETDVNGSMANFNYDDFGRLQSVDGPYDVGTNNHTISFVYSEVGVPVSSGVPANNPVPAYAVTSNRDVQHPTQPIVTSTFADGLNRIIQTKKNLARDTGNGVQVGMQVSGQVVYDDQGRMTEQRRPYFDMQAPTVMVSQTTPRALITEYDVLDRAVVTKTPLSGPAGGEADRFATTTTTYGIGQINGTNRLSMTVSDANVKASTSANPLPGFDHLELRGVRGDILKVVEQNRLAGSATPTTLTTAYGYDALSQLLSVTDAKGNVTRATYDTLGRIVTLISPDAGRTDFQFDLSGNLAAKQTSNLAPGFQLIRYEYDFNRLKKINYPNSPDVSYEYGSSTEAGPIGLNRASRIKKETSDAGIKQYEYDALGNINEETWTLNRLDSASTTERTLAYDYDSFGRLLAIYYPGASGEKVSYGYDAGGNLDTVTGVTKKGVTTNYVQHIGYDEFEQKALIKVGNGITTTFAYDPFTRRLSGIDASQRDPALVQAGLPARPFQKVAYQYDPVGNVTQISNTAPFDVTQTGSVKVGPATEIFSYDDLYQLRTADGLHQTSATNRYHYGESLTYDSISNVVQKAQLSEAQKLSGSTVTQTTTRSDQTYSSAFVYPTTVRPHAPSEVNDTVPGTSTLAKRAFSYDKNGNQSSWQRTTGTPTTRTTNYSDDNRATKVTQGGVILQEARYDGLGQRLVKRANGSSQTAYFGQYVTVRDEVPATKHVYAGDLRVASKFVPNETNEECAACTDRASVTYFHGDQLGSTTFATDEAQNLVAHEQYFPSGELWVDQTSDATHTRQPYLFNGKELDAETGLYYYGARYYDPRLGLWTSPDPILAEYMQGETNGGVHLPQNLALYSYSWNNPVTIRDPNGKCPMCITALIGGAIGGAIGGGVYLARAAITGGDVTARGLAGAAAGGAITGAVAGLTGGASLAVQVGAGAAAGAVGGIASRGIETGDASKTFDPKAIATDAALGGAFAGVAYGVGKGINAMRAGSKGAATAASEEAGAVCSSGGCAGTGCFVAGTLVTTERGDVPIEQLRIGERVNAGNPRCANEHLPPDARTIHLTMPDPAQPFEQLELDVVRPLSWLAAQGFDTGTGWVELQDVGISGWATVTGIDPAPPEQGGSGCLVVTTIQHLASQVLAIRLSGTPEVLQLTPSHPLYVEGAGWTPAGDLAPGVYLRTDTGSVAIESIESALPNQRVYNVEVGLEHAYRVTASGVWAHNACPTGGGGKTPPNPYGRKGGPAHQAKVQEVAADIESRNLTAAFEHKVPTPGGTKGTRFADVVAKDAEGNVVEMHQVGRQTKGGNPVSREVKALDDIENATDVRPEYHPYN